MKYSYDVASTSKKRKKKLCYVYIQVVSGVRVCFIDKGNLVPCVQTVLPDQGPGSVSGV